MEYQVICPVVCPIGSLVRYGGPCYSRCQRAVNLEWSMNKQIVDGIFPPYNNSNHVVMAVRNLYDFSTSLKT